MVNIATFEYLSNFNQSRQRRTFETCILLLLGLFLEINKAFQFLSFTSMHVDESWKLGQTDTLSETDSQRKSMKEMSENQGGQEYK